MTPLLLKQRLKTSDRRQHGFTIVELLVVIVVIAILAAITTIAFNGVKQSSVDGILKHDASSAYTQLETYKVSNGDYPSDTSLLNNNSGLKKGGDTSAEYTYSAGSFCLTLSSSGTFYYIQAATGNRIMSGSCVGHTGPTGPSLPAGYESAPVASGGSTDVGGYSPVQPSSCPSEGGNWVKVPGNSLYGTTNGFCIQQYPASNVSGVATSQASSNRWTSITQDAASTAASSITSGSHLVTELEWMTMAANAAMQPANWTGGSVGSGTLPVGSATSSRGTASFVLSNGSRVYYDTANVSFNAATEWTCYTGTNASNCGIAAQYQPTPAGAFYTDQLAALVTTYGSFTTNTDGRYYGDPRFANPSLAPYITSARTAGLGYLRSSYAAGSGTVFSVSRGAWTGANSSGLFSHNILTAQNYAHATYGFRAAR